MTGIVAPHVGKQVMILLNVLPMLPFAEHKTFNIVTVSSTAQSSNQDKESLARSQKSVEAAYLLSDFD